MIGQGPSHPVGTMSQLSPFITFEGFPNDNKFSIQSDISGRINFDVNVEPGGGLKIKEWNNIGISQTQVDGKARR